MESHVIPSLIDTEATLDPVLAHLRTQPLVALDTEADSLYHYYPKVCLIQLSASTGTPDAVADYLIDPLRLSDLQSLGDALARPDVEVVMHAAENDMLLLARNFGFAIRRIFDTQLAARILGWPRVGLAAILEEQFGVISDKRMQRTDWSRRPLTPQQLTYATNDTHYLLRLRDVLIDALKDKGRWDEAQDAFAQMVALDAKAEPAEARSFWDMKGVRDVPREQHAVLQVLWEWREAEARRRDLPPFKIANDSVLMDLADFAPRSRQELRRVRGMGESAEARYGSTILSAISDGLHRPVPALPPRRTRPEQWLDESAQVRFDALRDWRNHTAEQRGVALEIVFNTATLIAIAQRNPRSLEDLDGIVGVSPWKLNAYGAAILAEVTSMK